MRTRLFMILSVMVSTQSCYGTGETCIGIKASKAGTVKNISFDRNKEFEVKKGQWVIIKVAMDAGVAEARNLKAAEELAGKIGDKKDIDPLAETKSSLASGGCMGSYCTSGIYSDICFSKERLEYFYEAEEWLKKAYKKKNDNMAVQVANCDSVFEPK